MATATAIDELEMSTEPQVPFDDELVQRYQENLIQYGETELENKQNSVKDL